MTRLRTMASVVIFMGASLLVAPTPASSTILPDPTRITYCCGFDRNGDGRPEIFCCFDTGCSATARGCVRVT